MIKILMPFVIGFFLATLLIKVSGFSDNRSNSAARVALGEAPVEPLDPDAGEEVDPDGGEEEKGQLRGKVLNLVNENKNLRELVATAQANEQKCHVEQKQQNTVWRSADEAAEGIELSKFIQSSKLDAVKVKLEVRLFNYLPGFKGERESYFYSNGSFIIDLVPFGKFFHDSVTGKTFYEGSSKTTHLSEVVGHTLADAKNSNKLVKLNKSNCSSANGGVPCETWKRTFNFKKGIFTGAETPVDVLHEASVIPWKTLLPNTFDVAATEKSIAKVFGSDRILSKGASLSAKYFENEALAVTVKFLSKELVKNHDFPGKRTFAKLVLDRPKCKIFSPNYCGSP